MMEREIFGIGPGGYAMCTVMETADDYMLVQCKDDGKLYVCIKACGTWKALETFDLYRELVKLKTSGKGDANDGV